MKMIDLQFRRNLHGITTMTVRLLRTAIRTGSTLQPTKWTWSPTGCYDLLASCHPDQAKCSYVPREELTNRRRPGDARRGARGRRGAPEQRLLEQRLRAGGQQEERWRHLPRGERGAQRENRPWRC